MAEITLAVAPACPIQSAGKEKLALLDGSHRSIKIDPFLFDDQRPLQNLSVDDAGVFHFDAEIKPFPIQNHAIWQPTCCGQTVAG